MLQIQQILKPHRIPGTAAVWMIIKEDNGLAACEDDVLNNWDKLGEFLVAVVVGVTGGAVWIFRARQGIPGIGIAAMQAEVEGLGA